MTNAVSGPTDNPPPPFVLPTGPARLTQPTAKGVPAISPRSSATPSFTSADAEAYARSVPHKYRNPAGPAPTLQSVSFVPYGIVTKQLYAQMGLADNALVCVITESGNFIGPPGPRAGAKPATGTIGYRIFDAQTGNLLTVGFTSTPLQLTP
jgi:hypothetical protein